MSLPSAAATEPLLQTFGLGKSFLGLQALQDFSVAVDDDPGTKADLTILGLASHQVVAVEVLHGFEQQLVTDYEGGDLVIRNFLVKDYPVFLWLSGVAISP